MIERFIAAAQVPIDNIPKVDVTSATIGSILSATFVLVGGLAVLFLLVGAVRYVASGGDQSMIQQAKNTILYAVIGIVVSLSAFSIVQFVVGSLST